MGCRVGVVNFGTAYRSSPLGRVLWPTLVRELGYLQRIELILVPWAGLDLDLDLYLIFNARDDRKVWDKDLLWMGV